MSQKPIPTSNERTSQKGRLLQLLSPSWLSGLAAVVVALLVVVGGIVALRYSGSDAQLLRHLETNEPKALTSNSQSFDSSLKANDLIANIPLFIFWAGVGMLAYTLTINIARAFGSVVELQTEMDYLHVDRQGLLKEALLHFGLRALALVSWLLFIQYTIHVLVPYVTALAYAGSGGIGWAQGPIYLLAATCLMALTVHVHAILLRLLFLRPRVFAYN